MSVQSEVVVCRTTNYLLPFSLGCSRSATMLCDVTESNILIKERPLFFINNILDKNLLNILCFLFC